MVVSIDALAVVEVVVAAISVSPYAFCGFSSPFDKAIVEPQASVVVDGSWWWLSGGVTWWTHCGRPASQPGPEQPRSFAYNMIRCAGEANRLRDITPTA